MPGNALIYARAVVATGVMLAVGALLLWNPADLALFAACLGLAAVASTFKVNLPGMDGTMSPAFVFLLLAAGELSWPETVAISVVSALVQSLWKPKRSPTELQVAFSAAALAIAGSLAYGVAHGLAVAGSGTMQAPFLAVAGVVLLVANTILVAVILCLIQNTSVQNAWRSIQVWAVPYYLGGGILASLWGGAPLTAGVRFAILATVSVYPSMSAASRSRGNGRREQCREASAELRLRFRRVKQVNNGRMTFEERQVERRLPRVGSRLTVGVVLEQKPHCLLIAILRRRVERREPALLQLIHVRAV